MVSRESRGAEGGGVLASLHRLQFYRRQRDWRLEPEHSRIDNEVNEPGASRGKRCNTPRPARRSRLATAFPDQAGRAGRCVSPQRSGDISSDVDVAPSGGLPRHSDSEVWGSNSSSPVWGESTSLRDIDADVIGGSFFHSRSLGQLLDELTFCSEADERPHSSHVKLDSPGSVADTTGNVPVLAGLNSSSNRNHMNVQNYPYSETINMITDISVDSNRYDDSLESDNNSNLPRRNETRVTWINKTQNQPYREKIKVYSPKHNNSSTKKVKEFNINVANPDHERYYREYYRNIEPKNLNAQMLVPSYYQYNTTELAFNNNRLDPVHNPYEDKQECCSTVNNKYNTNDFKSEENKWNDNVDSLSHYEEWDDKFNNQHNTNDLQSEEKKWYNYVGTPSHYEEWDEMDNTNEHKVEEKKWNHNFDSLTNYEEWDDNLELFEPNEERGINKVEFAAEFKGYSGNAYEDARHDEINWKYGNGKGPTKPGYEHSRLHKNNEYTNRIWENNKQDIPKINWRSENLNSMHHYYTNGRNRESLMSLNIQETGNDRSVPNTWYSKEQENEVDHPYIHELDNPFANTPNLYQSHSELRSKISNFKQDSNQEPQAVNANFMQVLPRIGNYFQHNSHYVHERGQIWGYKLIHEEISKKPGIPHGASEISFMDSYLAHYADPAGNKDKLSEMALSSQSRQPIERKTSVGRGRGMRAYLQ